MKKKVFFSECPRCGDRGMEHLETYAHCVGCNYNSVEGLFPDRSIMSEKKAMRELIQRLMKESDERRNKEAVKDAA